MATTTEQSESSFLVSLWESIFTPGPTDTLLLATNVSFAALQLLLLLMLIATYSYHFIILGVLCAGLWAAINWFVREIRLVQLQTPLADDTSAKQIDHATNQIDPASHNVDDAVLIEREPVEEVMRRRK